jgi:hypothetical protein
VKRLALEAHGAPPGLHEAEDGAQRRGLARAVGADQRHDLPGLDGQRDPAQRPDIAVVSVNVGKFEHRP